MTAPLKDLAIKPFPKAWRLRDIIGPSFILLGLGLGSGEVILWPYLASQYGMGMLWGAILGLSFQFFMNMEIERYTLACGESIFVGMARKTRLLSFWFLVSSFVPWIWPGIIGTSAALVGYVVGVQQTQYVTVVFLIVIGLILSLGPVLYKTVEALQKILIMIGVPSIFLISLLLARTDGWVATAQGLVGIGNGFWLLPIGVGVSVILPKFLSALAYSGAGGNLNLAQSFYIREKGFGMGKYAGRITSLFTGKKEAVSLEGTTFVADRQSIHEFKKWWRRINAEHFLVFWLTGSITIILLMLLAYSTLFGAPNLKDNIGFVIQESVAIGGALVPVAGTFFLLVAGLTLFGTQLTVFDATSRIMAENLVLALPSKLKAETIPRLYYAVLWLFIVCGIIIILFANQQPLQLLVIAAILNAFAMFVHSGLTIWLNRTRLPAGIRPNTWRTVVMVVACIFYGAFSLYVIADGLGIKLA